MKPSEYDGQRVLHVDSAAIAHSGVVVGQSDDGKQVYIQSDRPAKTPAPGWDFAVDADLVPVLMQNAAALGAKRVKYTQAAANYSPHATDPAQRCALCQHYRASGHCQIVEGAISANGWCKYFEVKQR